MSSLRRYVDNPWYPRAWLVAVLAAWVLWARRPDWGWAVALAAAPGLLRALLRGVLRLPSTFDLLLAAFLLTAGVGLWAGYDPHGAYAVFDHPIGWQKLWGLLLAASFYYALAAQRKPAALQPALAVLAGVGALIAVVFVATHDWTAEPAKLALFTRLGRSIQALLPALPGGGLIHPNVAGGIVAPMLVFSLGLAVDARRRWEDRGARLWAAWGLLAAAPMGLALLLSTSRGAWAGTACALALAALWWLAGRLGRGRPRLPLVAAALAACAVVGLLALALFPPLRAATLGSQALASRLGLVSEGLLLVRDYPFTGLGLGHFPLPHAMYALLIHVPILSHAHVLWLNVAIEQGLPGALAALSLYAAAGWLGLRALARTRETRPLLGAGLLALAVLLVHSLVDDPFYGSRGVLFMWAPVGVIGAAAGGRRGERERGRGGRGWQWVAVGGGAAVVLGLAFWGDGVAAAWYANLGARAQALVELPRYDYEHFDNPLIDTIRREEDLSAAQGYFRRALELDPGQVTARTRLAQIALARGEYEAALAHAQAAWDAGHHDRVTRLLLGDALVAAGQVQPAAELVRGTQWAISRLNGQGWYRYWLAQDWQRAAYAYQTSLLIDPQDGYARDGLEQAQARIEPQP